MYDVLIIGKGPAGLTTALYTVRANLKTMVIGKDNGALDTAVIGNIFGISKPTKGKVLIKNTCNNLKNLGCEFRDEEVINIIPQEDSVLVKTENDCYETKNLVLATGKEIKNDMFSKYLSKGVSYCATCDGFFYKNKIVGVVGNTKLALEEAEYLKNIAKEVYIFLNGEKAYADFGNFQVIKQKIKKLNGQQLQSITIDNRNISVDALFMANKFSANKFATIGILTKNSHIVTDKSKRTNFKNIYAVGDITGTPYQIAKANYDGMICSLDIIKNANKQNRN